MPWQHNLSPFALGPFGPSGFGIRWYGLSYILGFALGFFALRRAVQQRKITGLELDQVETLVVGFVIGVLGGGRIGYCVQYPDRLIKDPLFLIKVNEGGMAFFGGLCGVILALLYFRRKYGLNLWELGDVLAPVAAFSLGLGRIANFINGELYGKKTGSDWGVLFKAAPDAARHPSQLYDAASHLLLAALLVILARTKFGQKTGRVSCLFMIGYGLFRIVTEIYREQDYYVGPLSGGQIASIIMALVGVALWFVSQLKAKEVGTEKPNKELK